jgi:hypothetical protein
MTPRCKNGPPITPAEIERRYAALRAAMERDHLDALLVCGNQYAGFEGAVRYLSGFEIVHRYAYVLLPLAGEPTLVFPAEARWIGDKNKPWVREQVWPEIPGRWLRDRVEFLIVPFVDKDGVEEGDQGKNRHPHDHNRDYATPCLYPEVQALRERAAGWSGGPSTGSGSPHPAWEGPSRAQSRGGYPRASGGMGILPMVHTGETPVPRLAVLPPVRAGPVPIRGWPTANWYGAGASSPGHET